MNTIDFTLKKIELEFIKIQLSVKNDDTREFKFIA